MVLVTFIFLNKSYIIITLLVYLDLNGCCYMWFKMVSSKQKSKRYTLLLFYSRTGYTKKYTTAYFDSRTLSSHTLGDTEVNPYFHTEFVLSHIRRRRGAISCESPAEHILF